jgi:hypothetical protein
LETWKIIKKKKKKKAGDSWQDNVGRLKAGHVQFKINLKIKKEKLFSLAKKIENK